jgi:hypothetical protein
MPKFGKGGAAVSTPGTYSAPVGKGGKVPRAKGRDTGMPSNLSYRKMGRGGKR